MSNRIRPPKPDWPVNLQLEDGRTVRASVAPAPARRDDLGTLARATAAQERRLDRGAAGLAALRRANARLARDVQALRAQASRAAAESARREAAERQRAARLDADHRRFAAEAAALRRQAAEQRREIEGLRTSQHIQSVMSVVTAVQAAAFGESGTVGTTTNLLLMGNQLLWSAMGPLLRSLGGSDPASSALAWVSPVGAIATGQAMLADRHQERLVSGVTTFDGNLATIPLRGRIAEAHFAAFSRRTDVPVTLVPLDPVATERLHAVVRDGTLEIRLANKVGAIGPGRGRASVPVGRVAWIIDTGGRRG